jgi:hypothetical protein
MTPSRNLLSRRPVAFIGAWNPMTATKLTSLKNFDGFEFTELEFMRVFCGFSDYLLVKFNIF